MFSKAAQPLPEAFNAVATADSGPALALAA